MGNNKCEYTWICNYFHEKKQKSAKLTTQVSGQVHFVNFVQVCNTFHESALNHKS